MPEKAWRVFIWVGIMLIAFLGAISIKEIKSISYVGKDIPMTNTISVSGTGDALALPDVAAFSFTVTENAKTVAEAQSKATDKINNALKALKNTGVSDKDVKTTSYNINPRYEYQDVLCGQYGCPPGKSVLTGYEVSEGVNVKVRDLDKAGSVLSLIGSLNVQNVNSLVFSIDKPESVQAEARSKAIGNARAKAEELAKELGVSLTRITGFYESNSARPMIYGMGGGKTAVNSVSATPEIPSGEQKVTSDVNITYEIK